ncbi:MAG TPA: lysophospholipase [Candidatus Paceibacterota bacterium]|nr:lysophospholipase [Verrucomicrobiota bacterium]HSA11046.1 lysophospholipase [Candidatus Paceibacterota bacterium]
MIPARNQYTLHTADHWELSAQEWLPESAPHAVVCLIHGLGEHSSRYAHVAGFLTRAGFVLNTFDLRGHGNSPGQRGHVQSYETCLDDIQCLLDDTARRYAGKSIFLYGQSLGGGLALNFALRRKSHLAGVIATAPLLRLAFEPPLHRVILAKVMNRVRPAHSNVCGCEAAALSRDPAVVRRYVEDPLNHDLISARLYVEASRAGLWALAHAAELRLRALVMHGDADRLTSADASRQFAERAGRCCTLKIWDGAYHELHNEPEKDAVFAYILAWLKDAAKRG